jgi:acetamidase/formamidase
MRLNNPLNGLLVVTRGNTSLWYSLLQVAGALLSMGDAHIAQGDSEFDGTGIETSITGKFKITLHKKGSLPKIVKVRRR